MIALFFLFSIVALCLPLIASGALLVLAIEQERRQQRIYGDKTDFPGEPTLQS